MGHLHGRLIAFDLDGTLVDSRRDLADAANELIASLGGSPLPEETIGRMVGEGAQVLVDRALRAARILPPECEREERPTSVAPLSKHVGGESCSGSAELQASGFRREALDRFLAIYDARLLNHTRPYHGIADAVAAAASRARVAVLTNKPLRATERILEGLGLRAPFEDVIGGDGTWPRKPDPASLLELMRRAGATPATTLLVGDSAIDHETALRAGARCCVAGYGFGYDTFPPERLTGSEFVVRTAAELPGVFARFAAD